MTWCAHPLLLLTVRGTASATSSIACKSRWAAKRAVADHRIRCRAAAPRASRKRRARRTRRAASAAVRANDAAAMCLSSLEVVGILPHSDSAFASIVVDYGSTGSRYIDMLGASTVMLYHCLAAVGTSVTFVAKTQAIFTKQRSVISELRIVELQTSRMCRVRQSPRLPKIIAVACDFCVSTPCVSQSLLMCPVRLYAL